MIAPICTVFSFRHSTHIPCDTYTYKETYVLQINRISAHIEPQQSETEQENNKKTVSCGPIEKKRTQTQSMLARKMKLMYEQSMRLKR